jgi:predicted nucleic acid-binding protein
VANRRERFAVSDSPIVLDASAAIAIIRLEPPAPALLASLRDTVAKGSSLLVPDGFWLELVNVLIRRYRAAPEKAIEAVRDIDDLGVESVRVDRPLLFVAIDLQARLGLSAYDASYLALAETVDARLLTLDRHLSLAAGPRAIRVPGLGQERFSELPTPYGEPVDWARFGPYLARLRADAHKVAGA